MAAHREIRADFDRETLVVYQAYSAVIAEPALAAGRFVAPFSMTRMTWIKPSLTWLLVRSNWARRSGQERILGVRIRRAGWEEALGEAVLTEFEASVHGSREHWAQAFDRAPIHVQWDPERSLRGAKLPHRSIQVGVSRHRIERFVDEWIVGLEDLTSRVRAMREHVDAGRVDRARRLLPAERPYPLGDALMRRLGMG